MRPSVGKGGAHGCFVVEVLKGKEQARVLARRFVTKEEARDFFDRTVQAYRAKALREGVQYEVHPYQTETPRSTAPIEHFDWHAD